MTFCGAVQNRAKLLELGRGGKGGTGNKGRSKRKNGENDADMLRRRHTAKRRAD